MTNEAKKLLEGWGARMLISEVAMASQYATECKHEFGRNAQETQDAREELQFTVELLDKKVKELEEKAKVADKVVSALELINEIMEVQKNG
ncbi:MAG: hypothetical protein IKU35_06580 [Bacteroidaceae bacterium]|nr:hypothetical protein [Bacteroidaceae bacterium]